MFRSVVLVTVFALAGCGSEEAVPVGPGWESEIDAGVCGWASDTRDGVQQAQQGNDNEAVRRHFNDGAFALGTLEEDIGDDRLKQPVDRVRSISSEILGTVRVNASGSSLNAEEVTKLSDAWSSLSSACDASAEAPQG